VGATLAERASLWATAVRVAVALGFAGVLFVKESGVARGIEAQRDALIEGLRRVLPASSRPATNDVGWVGAAHAGTVVDLAGVTDEQVAVLPGGHTSKRLPEDFLWRREVDALVLLLAPGEVPRQEWSESRFARTVEVRVARLARDDRFVIAATLPLAGAGQQYVVLVDRELLGR
jgi:hypothetical protein